MNTIKAIETRYRGYHFRSRLEARWAVFFDALGVRWEYEPEGFILPSGEWYLPDFRVWTPQQKPTWYEIKPNTEDRFSSKIADFLSECEERGGPLVGDPLEFMEGSAQICGRCGLLYCENSWKEIKSGHFSVMNFGVSVNKWALAKEFSDEEQRFHCDYCDFESWKDGEISFVKVERYKGDILISGIDCARISRHVLKAAGRARSARFEHGQQG